MNRFGTDKAEFMQVRHEEMPASMASDHAKFTGEPGVCMAASSPGASHLITGLYDAHLDHQPMLAIVGQQARAAVGGDYQRELDPQTAAVRASSSPRPSTGSGLTGPRPAPRPHEDAEGRRGGRCPAASLLRGARPGLGPAGVGSSRCSRSRARSRCGLNRPCRVPPSPDLAPRFAQAILRTLRARRRGCRGAAGRADGAGGVEGRGHRMRAAERPRRAPGTGRGAEG